MIDLSPQHIKQARRLLNQGASQAQAVESLLLMGISTHEANQIVSQAQAERAKLAGYQKQALIAMALGFAGTLIGVGAALVGEIVFEAVSIGPTLLVFGGIGWVLTAFFSDAALWLIQRPLLILIAAVVAIIGALAGVFTFLM